MIRQLAAIPLLLLLASCAAGDSPDRLRSNEGTLQQPFPEPVFAEGSAYSLVTGRIRSQEFRGSFACPENSICMDGVFEFTFRDLRTLAGPKIGRTETFLFPVHTFIVRKHPVAFVVRRAADGRLWVRRLRILYDNEACFGTWVKEGIPALRGKLRTDEDGDEEFCVKVD